MNTLTHIGMALIASGAEEKARQDLAEARNKERAETSVEQKMMECLKTSNRLLDRVQQGRPKK